LSRSATAHSARGTHAIIVSWIEHTISFKDIDEYILSRYR